MANVYSAYAVTTQDYHEHGLQKVVRFLDKSEQEVVNELYPDMPWLADSKGLQGLYKIGKASLYLDKSWEDIPLLLEQLGFKKALAAFKSYVFEKETGNGPVWVLCSVDWKNFIRGICGKAASTEEVIDAFCDKTGAKINDDFFADFGGRDYALYLLGHLKEFLKYGFKWAPNGYNLIIV